MITVQLLSMRSYVYHYSTIQKSFTALKTVCLCILVSCPKIPGNRDLFYSLYSFAFSGMSDDWNYMGQLLQTSFFHLARNLFSFFFSVGIWWHMKAKDRPDLILGDFSLLGFPPGIVFGRHLNKFHE